MRLSQLLTGVIICLVISMIILGSYGGWRKHQKVYRPAAQRSRWNVAQQTTKLKKAAARLQVSQFRVNCINGITEVQCIVVTNDGSPFGVRWSFSLEICDNRGFSYDVLPIEDIRVDPRIRRYRGSLHSIPTNDEIQTQSTKCLLRFVIKRELPIKPIFFIKATPLHPLLGERLMVAWEEEAYRIAVKSIEQGIVRQRED